MEKGQYRIWSFHNGEKLFAPVSGQLSSARCGAGNIDAESSNNRARADQTSAGGMKEAAN
jgi:hypothetical protein